MPILQIGRGGLSAEHAAATFDYVISVMIWPTECDMRREFQRSCGIARRTEAAAAVPGLPVGGDLFKEALAAWPPDLLAREARPQIERGFGVV
jgi:hypothetical protein